MRRVLGAGDYGKPFLNVPAQNNLCGSLSVCLCDFVYRPVVQKLLSSAASAEGIPRLNLNAVLRGFLSDFDTLSVRMTFNLKNRVASMTQANSGKLKSHSEAIQNIVRTFNNTVLYLYRQWVADGRKIPMEEMIELATTLIERGVKGFLGS